MVDKETASRWSRLESFEEIAEAFLVRQDRALAKGFKFLRAAGDTGWVSRTEESKSRRILVNGAPRPPHASERMSGSHAINPPS